MEKYYIPEIEEFCIGLDFEYLGDRDENNNRWHKDIVTKSNFWTFAALEDRLNNYDSALIRVKYLDKEDIESLEFKLFSIQEDKESIWCQFKHISDDLTQIHCQLGLKFINKNKGVRINLSTRYDGHIGIIIKNKSELKKLLKQLCITK